MRRARGYYAEKSRGSIYRGLGVRLDELNALIDERKKAGLYTREYEISRGDVIKRMEQLKEKGVS